MSTIEKLYIQGVRGFGCNAEDAQSITFSSPITLILGQNGCGKTTIIECLKYALTGECPPGSESGKSFVHDPKIFGRTESLGQVKMVVRDKSDARLSICRSMKVTVGGDKKITFKTLDSTLTPLGYADNKVKANRSMESISLRLGDMDKSIGVHMGVSKAIINSVLFCHQEDSSWPLDEGMKLKNKFDAIFGIEEYNKALDNLSNLQKNSEKELGVMEAEIKLLAHLKKEMDDKTLNLQKYEQQCEEIKQRCENLDEKVKPIETRLQEILKTEYEISKHTKRKVEMDTTHKNCVEQIAKISKSIKKKFEGTLIDLDLEIQSFNQRMSETRIKKTEVEEQLQQLNNSNAELQRTLSNQDKELYVVKQKIKLEQECRMDLNKCINKFCTELQVSVDKNMREQPEKLDEMLHKQLAIKQTEITELTEQHDEADQSRQSKIDELRTEITKSEQNLKTQEQQKISSQQESEALELKIKQIEISVHQLKALDKQIKEKDAEYEQLTHNFNQEESRRSIAAKRLDISKKQLRFKHLDKELTFLSSIAKQMAEINVIEKGLDKKNQDINRLKSKHSDNLKTFLKSPISNNYRRAIQAAHDKLQAEIQDLNLKVNSQKLQEQSFENERKNLMSDIAKMQKDLQQFEERIYQKCRSTPYEELMLKSKATIAKLQLEHGALKSSENMYKTYIQKIDEKTDCPLCHRDMNSDEASDLITEMTDKIQNLPDNINKSEKSLKLEQAKYEELLEIKPAIDKVKELKENLPKKQEELRRIEQQLSETIAEYESQMSLLGEPTCNKELATSMLGDMTLLDEALKEAGRLSKDLEQLKLKLPQNYDASVSAEELQAEKNQVSRELEIEAKTVEKEQEDLDLQMEKINRLRELRTSLKDQSIKLQEGQQSLPQFKERLDELTGILITIATEISELKSKVQPLKHKLTAAIEEKERLKRNEQAKLSELNKNIHDYKMIVKDIQKLNKQLQEYVRMQLSDKLAKLDATIVMTKEELGELKLEIQQSNKKLEALSSECHGQQLLERDLKDNRELKQLEMKEVQLKEDCRALDKQLGNLDYFSVDAEKKNLIKKREHFSVQRGELLGQKGEVQNSVNKLKREINEPQYRESLKNYRRAQFEEAIKRRQIADLREHKAALEWALIQFHMEKMRNINSLIRQYWRMIYKGNDIDYIEITADEPKATASKRRNFSYKVMQCKNGSKIDMRGRCSAGQRVLASLIIRLALAETFSCNCGVFALDEPTTNLDKENITSLCEALNIIVEERQEQSNFMLIIITHDEGFISTLGKVENYHRVIRNAQGKSAIEMVRVDDR